MIHELQVRKEIADLQEQRDDQGKHLKYIDHLLSVSKWLTFGLYFAFTLSLYLGDILHLQTLVTSWFGSVPGFIFYMIICIALAYVLAGIKHAAYSHFAQFGVSVGIVAVVIAMGLIAEVFQSSGNQDTKARAITESNPEYQKIVNTSPSDNIRVDGRLASQIAAAEQTLARCIAKRDAGKEKHCRGDQAKLDSYKASQNSFMDKQVQAAGSITQKQFDRLEQLKNDSYNPVIRSISSMTGVKLATAIGLIMLFIAANFEILHYFLSSMKAKTLAAIRRLNDAIRALEIQYYNVAGTEFDGTAHTPPPATAETKTEWTPFGKPATAEMTPEVPAPTAPPTTCFKYQEQQVAAKPEPQKFVGFVNPNAPATSSNHPNPHSDAHPDGFATSAKHPNHQRIATDRKPLLGKADVQLDIPQLSTYNRELGKHNIASPADPAMNQEADQDSIQRIISKGLEAAGTPSSNHPENETQNRPTPHPDAHPDGLSDHPEKHPDAAPTAQEVMADPGKLEVIKGYMKHDKFNEIFIAICTGQTKPSQNGIKSHKVGGDMPKYVLVIMCYFGLVTEPKANKQRDLIAKLTPEQAQQELADARIIMKVKE